MTRRNHSIGGRATMGTMTGRAGGVGGAGRAHRTRRRVVAASPAVPAMALLSACGQASQGPAREAVSLAKQPPMKLEIGVEATAGRKAQGEIWNARYPNVEITPVAAPTGTGV